MTRILIGCLVLTLALSGPLPADERLETRRDMVVRAIEKAAPAHLDPAPPAVGERHTANTGQHVAQGHRNDDRTADLFFFHGLGLDRPFLAPARRQLRQAKGHLIEDQVDQGSDEGHGQ